jgi:hypothetical protein
MCTDDATRNEYKPSCKASAIFKEDNEEGVEKLHDGGSGEPSFDYENHITLDGEYTFFGKTYSNVSLCENGVLSFGSGFDGSECDKTPSHPSHPLIAAFWGDIAQSSHNPITYIELSAEDEERFRKRSSQVLNMLWAAFRGSVSKFNPTHLFVATWYQLPHYNQTTGETVTFQLVLATEECKQETYALLLYDETNWNVSNGADVWVGFSEGSSGRNYTHSLYTQGRTLELANDSNIGLRGAYVYRIDKVEIIDPSVSCDGLSDPTNGCVQISGYPGSSGRNYTHPLYAQGRMLELANDSNIGLRGAYVYRIDKVEIIDPSVSCDGLSDPTNGRVQISGGCGGLSARYTCSDGYNLTGDSERKCPNGTWSGSAPECKGRDFYTTLCKVNNIHEWW